MYKITSHYPLAKFYYKGNHSHPVRRTILIIETDKEHLTGYELREGSITRDLKEAPVKTYKKKNIAKYFNCDKRLKFNEANLNKSTLKRYRWKDLLIKGI